MTEILDSFDGGLRIDNVGILFNIYRKEKISIENRRKYEKYLEETYPDDYENFLEYKSKVKAKTPNIKELIFNWLDGKSEILEFKLCIV
ncbi:MAG: hypothetical protein IJL02_11565 [Methanobrevibacter sp.]|uniref:hypothetical protein n=1 Tax=Methanobrevibacter sp. TaxID=66852 RepID=UPI0025E0622D|nr:hypothetical protein [Methanobrevibacter sp.]MBQ6100484.1 hypothetical protein [Methanobrevibacter sp.]